MAFRCRYCCVWGACSDEIPDCPDFIPRDFSPGEYPSDLLSPHPSELELVGDIREEGVVF